MLSTDHINYSMNVYISRIVDDDGVIDQIKCITTCKSCGNHSMDNYYYECDTNKGVFFNECATMRDQY